MVEKPKPYKGTLFLYSETGTEGGYWALQDEDFISLKPPTFGIGNGEKVRDRNDPGRQGTTSDVEVFIDNSWLEYPDPIWKDGDFAISSLYRGERNGDLNADRRLSEKYGFRITYSGEGSGQSTVPPRPYGIPNGGKTRVTVKWEDGSIEHRKGHDSFLVEQWGYEGLHILANGDHLKIYHPLSNEPVWQGPINLRLFIPFTESARGIFISSDQIGTDREKWAGYFFEGYRAELTKKDDHIEYPNL